jgi:hypothetical protein
VAKEGDGWLRERWVAKMEMGGYVGSAPACYGSSLGSNPDKKKIIFYENLTKTKIIYRGAH